MLGQTLTIDGERHTVIGIAPAAYTEMWRVDAWVPLARAVDQNTRGSNFLVVVGRLRDGLTIDQAQAGLSELATEMSRDYPDDRYGFFTMSLHEVLTRGPRQALWILLGATGLVLLIACANVANLILVRAVTRQREIAVRTALGAGHGRIVRQLVTETVLLAIVGGMLGVGLAAGLLRIFALVAPANFPRLSAISARWPRPGFLAGSGRTQRSDRRSGSRPPRRALAAERRAARGLARRHGRSRTDDEPPAGHGRNRDGGDARGRGRLDHP